MITSKQICKYSIIDLSAPIVNYSIQFAYTIVWNAIINMI